MTHLTKNERMQVQHNYISAVSSLEHKKDLINRLKRRDTHNIPAYEAEMSRHMTLHEDILERILNILKQENYYRTLEDLPVIDELTAYDDIKLFPELYDTSTIIERVPAEADLIERQLRRQGMYPQHTNLSHPTSNPPRNTPNSQPTSTNNSTESSPESSLPYGQRAPAASTSSSDVPSSLTPPQTFANTSHQPKIPTYTEQTSPTSHRQQVKMPLKTNVNQSSQSSIVGEDQQCVPKSADGTWVKCSKQQPRQQDEHLCFHCSLPGHLKRNCPEVPYCSKCRMKGHIQDRCTNKSQRTRHACQAGEPRDQRKRNDDLPQFSSHHNKCLQCAGDHQTTNCT